MRLSRRLILTLILAGLLVAPTSPILAADATPPGLIERVLDWIGWGLGSVTAPQEATDSAPPEPPPKPDITPEGAPDTSTGDPDGEMYPEWDPNG